MAAMGPLAPRFLVDFSEDLVLMQDIKGQRDKNWIRLKEPAAPTLTSPKTCSGATVWSLEFGSFPLRFGSGGNTAAHLATARNHVHVAAGCSCSTFG